MTVEHFKEIWEPKCFDDGYERFCFNLDLKALEQQIREDVIDELRYVMVKKYNKLNSRGKHYCYEFFRDCIEELKEGK